MAKFYLETHQYAPELNKIVFYRGGELSAPHITTIKDARKKYFKPVQFTRVCIMGSHYPAPYKSLNRTMWGAVDNYSQVIKVKRDLAERTKGGELLDGNQLPAANISIKTYMKGL